MERGELQLYKKQKKPERMLFPLWNAFYDGLEGFLEYLPYHRGLFTLLSDMDIGNCPNIVIHGPKGFPVIPLIELAICKMKQVRFPLSKRFPEWEGIPYTETDYYFGVNLAHPSFPKDIQVVIDFLLTIIRNRCIHVERHIVILENIHVLRETNPQAFRVILERFSQNVLFFGITDHIQQLEGPLLSRMLMFRVPLPTEEQNRAILKKLLGKKELRGEVGRNLARAIFLHEPGIGKKKVEGPLEGFLSDGGGPEEIRKLSLRLFQQNIEISEVAQELMERLKGEEEKHLFCKEAARIEQTAIGSDKAKVAFFLEHLLNIFEMSKRNHDSFREVGRTSSQPLHYG